MTNWRRKSELAYHPLELNSLSQLKHSQRERERDRERGGIGEGDIGIRVTVKRVNEEGI